MYRTNRFLRLIILVISIVQLNSVSFAEKTSIKEDDFWGLWVPSKFSTDCKILLTEGGEGGHFTLEKNYYEPGDGTPCDDVVTILRPNGSLRVIGSCDGEEYGYRPLVREFKILSLNKISSDSSIFVRCK